MDAIYEVMRGVLLERLVRELTTCEGEAVALLSFVCDRQLTGVDDVTLDEMRHIRSLAYPRYQAGDWEVDDEFRAIAVQVISHHRESAGQMRLI